MAVQNSTVALSAADAAAHRAASHVRTVIVPVQDAPKPPVDPAARRRFIQQREW
ncbi:MAG: hypothetical protein HOZ81_10400 [Streptomyces sp.]|nr:hypothetical protein [Streptomyces sp.]